MTTTISFNDTEVTFHYGNDGKVSVCSHWEWIDDLAKAGHLTSKNYGSSTYGHVDFFIA